MDTTSSNTKYKIGLALSGGGARGYAHLGALKALNERNIYPDIISGTSVGALIGALYADGYTSDEMFVFAKSLTFLGIAEGTFPRDGFFKSTKIQALLKKYLRVQTFEELKIPLRVIASDIELGQVKIFDSGDIIPAVVASCAVPIVFSPIEIEHHHYVDGGLLKNFPVSCIRKDCEKVIGVNISPVISMKYDRSLKYVIERTMNYMVGTNTAEERNACDYLIESHKISEYSLFDFKQINDIYKYGYEAAAKYLDENKERIYHDFFAPKPLPKKKAKSRGGIIKGLFKILNLSGTRKSSG